MPQVMWRELRQAHLLAEDMHAIIEAVAGDAAALVAQEERPIARPTLRQVVRGGQQRMLFQPVCLRLIRLLTIDGDEALLQVEILDVQTHNLAHPEGVFDEEDHHERIPRF